LKFSWVHIFLGHPVALERGIQVLNGLPANVHNPAPAVKIIRVLCVTHESSFLNAINCNLFAWFGLIQLLKKPSCKCRRKLSGIREA